MQAVLSLYVWLAMLWNNHTSYASGRTTGVVLDSGDGVTHAVPVVEGFALKHAITRVDVAGRFVRFVSLPPHNISDVTRYLQLLLRKEGHIFKTSAEFEEVRSIKVDAEEICFVWVSIKQETKCYVSTNMSKDEALDDHASEEHRLPDGNAIQVKQARFRAPEILFDPSLIGEECDGIRTQYGYTLTLEGVHRVLLYAIRKSDLDLRRKLFESIVLSGGSTLFKVQPRVICA